MLEKLLELDEKGIIAPDNYSISDYASFGDGMLDYCRNFQPIARLEMPVSVESRIRRYFKTEISWAVILRRDTAEYGGRIKKFSMNIHGFKADAPVILLADGSASTLLHECIHVIRDFAGIGSHTKAFEEAFADYAAVLPCSDSIPFFDLLKVRRSIRKAEKRLAEYLGDNAGYAVIRLLQSEINKVNESSNALECFKSFGRLRHKIMQERLGI